MNTDKIKENFDKAKAGIEKTVNKTLEHEVVKKMTTGQKLIALGVAAVLALLIVGGIGRLIFRPDASVWGVASAPVIQLSFKTEGVVAQVLFSEKQVVAKGDLIARIDDAGFIGAFENANHAAMEANLKLVRMEGPFKDQETAVAEAKLKAAESALEAANAEFELAKSYEEKYRSLAESGTVSDAHYEASLNAMNETEARAKERSAFVTAAKDELEVVKKGYSDEEISGARSDAEAATAKAVEAKAILDGSSIIAPFNAYIQKLDIKEGDKTVANEPVCELAELERIFIKATAEPHVDGLVVGKEVHIEFTDFAGEIFMGKITSVSPLEVELENPNESVLPGMEAVLIVP